MNKRERIILIVVGSLVGLGIVYLGLNAFLLKPAATLRERIADHKSTLAELEDAVDLGRRFADRFDRFLERTHVGGFDADGNATRRLVAEQLRALSLRSGLDEKTLDLRPATGGSGPPEGRFRETGMAVSTRGRLSDLIDFLYLIEAQPYLHRIENLTAEPDLIAGDVELSFKYLTPHLLPAKDAEAAPASRPTSRPAPVPLDTVERAVYEAVASRDLFRPYVRKQVVRRPPDPPRPPRPPDPPQPQPQPPTDPYFKIVGLPNWTGRTDDARVWVTDTRDRSTVEHTVGDSLGDGTIEAVDYRPLPTPGAEEILSPSRVILKIDGAWWVVELGQTLAQKRRVEAEALPERLRPQPEPEKDVTEPVPSVALEASVPAPATRPAAATRPSPTTAPKGLPASNEALTSGGETETIGPGER